MSEPQSFKNTLILINSVEYNALISSTRPEISTESEKFYNYRGDTLETGGGTVEYGDITLVFAEREFDQLRTDLGAVDVDGYYLNDLNDYPFTMTMKIEPDSTFATAKKQITMENCRIKATTQTDVAKDNVLYTTSCTVSVENVKEIQIA